MKLPFECKTNIKENPNQINVCEIFICTAIKRIVCFFVSCFEHTKKIIRIFVEDLCGKHFKLSHWQNVLSFLYFAVQSFPFYK